MNTLNLLIVDDHPLTCQGYAIFINNGIEEGKLPEINIDEAYTGKEAYDKLKDIDKNNFKYDIILLDLQIPVSEEDRIFSGEDLGVLVRKLNPEIKIIVQTGLLDNHRLYNVFKNLNPEGIIIKNDLDDVIFIQAICDVLDNVPFYSSTFAKLIRNQFSKDYVLDTVDREMLYLLSIGVASKDIPKYIPWSLSKVEKRKRLLREKLGVNDKSVLALVNKAKKTGFL
jgi:DNA-binding NarL/FixJ family response regulator